MIEASRIDHAGHANDAAGHIHDTIMYNDVMTYIKEHIDAHPDTQLLSAADHECGGLTLRDNYDPAALQASESTPEAFGELFESFTGDKGEYLKGELLPSYGLTNVTDADIQALLKIAEEEDTYEMGIAAGTLLAVKAGVHWSSVKHTAADVLLHGYANEKELAIMRGVLGKNNDNTDMPKYIERTLGLDLEKATKKLQSHGSDWIGKRDKLHLIKRANKHIHAHD